MTEKFKLDQLFAIVEQTDLQELMTQSMYNPDPEKRKVYDVLYHYVLDKRQEALINREEFII